MTGFASLRGMHHYTDTRISPYSTLQIFDLVLDIARYPEFLPWCRAARILETHEHRLVAELVVSFKSISESYVSEVLFARPSTPSDAGRIEVRLIRGPFEHLSNRWEFHPLPGGGSRTELDLSFRFRSKLLDSLIGFLFGKACARMGEAFTRRADALYGGKS